MSIEDGLGITPRMFLSRDEIKARYEEPKPMSEHTPEPHEHRWWRGVNGPVRCVTEGCKATPELGEHTPGPWHWTTVDTLYGDGEPGGRNLLVAEDGRFVAATKPDDDDIIVRGADARLIAAAPEMLALLRELGSQPFARTTDGCALCGGGGAEPHGDEWTETLGTVPCRIGAQLARIDGK